MKNMEIITPTVNSYIDFHTHILPGMDDGASNIQMSTEMLYMLKRQQVGTVVLTPHFYSDQENLPDFINRRKTAIKLLEPVLKELDIQFFLGCEMYFSDYIFNYEDIRSLCIGSGKYILTELPFGISDKSFGKLSKFIGDFNIRPILAHMERYPKIFNWNSISQLIDMGCLIQINLSSITEGFFQRRAILDLISRECIHIVGTDCHNISSRPPKFSEGISIIGKKLGYEYIETLMNQANLILQKS